MQLHPSDSANSTRLASESLSAGLIGLDFATDVGDLHVVQYDALPDDQRNYWAICHEMDVDDIVLVMAHHFPLALCRVADDYNYIRRIEPELGVWFRHFRRVDQISYFADVYTNAHDWPRITMTATISPLRNTGTESRDLIDDWMSRI